jgi:phasin
MNANSKPEAAGVDRMREALRKNSDQYEALLETTFPEVAREFAERTVAQAREAYERANRSLEASMETLEKSFDAAGQGAVALNHKIIEIAQRNLNGGFDLAKNLAGAKNLAEIVQLQAAYWQKQFGALTAQAEEVRALSTKVTAAAAEPVKAHVASGMDDARKAS